LAAVVVLCLVLAILAWLWHASTAAVSLRQTVLGVAGSCCVLWLVVAVTLGAAWACFGPVTGTLIALAGLVSVWSLLVGPLAAAGRYWNKHRLGTNHPA
jgi:hypothetical protein